LNGKNSEPSIGDDWLMVEPPASGAGFVQYKQTFVSAGAPFNITAGATVLFATINQVPTFNFSQVGVVVTVADAIADDTVDFYGTINI
jgi:hypothetical protein